MSDYAKAVKLSEHFTLEELIRSDTAKRLGIDNKPSLAQIGRMAWLAENVLEPTRKEFGPMFVTSGYRCPRLNKAVGGASNSAHQMLDETEDKHERVAADVWPQKADLRKVFDWLRLGSGLPFQLVILEFGRRPRHNSDDVIHLQSNLKGCLPRRALIGQTHGRGKYEKVRTV